MLKWVDDIWGRYDADGNGKLDIGEAWRFVDENLHSMVNRSNFFEEFMLTDQDQSNDLDRHELTTMIMRLKNKTC